MKPLSREKENRDEAVDGAKARMVEAVSWARPLVAPREFREGAASAMYMNMQPMVDTRY